MIEFGKSLRALRESKGFSIAQLADLTKMAPVTISELESEDFSHIAAPIYGRGFIKLYCTALGADPKPFIDEFMQIHNGNHELNIRERAPSETSPIPEAAVPPMPSVSPVSADEPVAPAPTTPDLFQSSSETNAAPPPAGQEPPLSRYAAPLRQPQTTFDPQAILRIGVLAALVLGVLILVGWGIRSVYRATTRTDAAGETAAGEAAAATAARTAEKRADRTPQKIPSLYID